jgi:hypothetical protein
LGRRRITIRQRGYVLLGRLHRVANTGVSGAQYESTHLVGVAHCQRLGDHAAHGPSEDIGVAQMQGGHKRACLVSHFIDAERRFKRRSAPYARVVESDYSGVEREAIYEMRIPRLHRSRVTHDK